MKAHLDALCRVMRRIQTGVGPASRRVWRDGLRRRRRCAISGSKRPFEGSCRSTRCAVHYGGVGQDGATDMGVEEGESSIRRDYEERRMGQSRHGRRLSRNDALEPFSMIWRGPASIYGVSSGRCKGECVDVRGRPSLAREPGMPGEGQRAHLVFEASCCLGTKPAVVPQISRVH